MVAPSSSMPGCQLNRGLRSMNRAVSGKPPRSLCSVTAMASARLEGPNPMPSTSTTGVWLAP